MPERRRSQRGRRIPADRRRRLHRREREPHQSNAPDLVLVSTGAHSTQDKTARGFLQRWSGSGDVGLLVRVQYRADETLDPQVAGAARIAVDVNSWTEFANVLYIDAPATGFSYPIANSDGTKPEVGIDIDRDAGIFLQVIARFLLRHPAILKNRVIIVGESYGGTRATLMLKYLYEYPSLLSGTAAYQDTPVAGDLNTYFLPVYGTFQPTATQIQATFGHQVLIEPVVVGAEQVVDDPDSRNERRVPCGELAFRRLASSRLPVNPSAAISTIATNRSVGPTPSRILPRRI